jgi:hypothetical protein
MDNLFKDILEIEGVIAVILFDYNGGPVYKNFKRLPSKKIEGKNWAALMGVLGPIQEAEVVFNECMMYTVRSKLGFLFIIMDKSASGALVRLNCSVILPSLNQQDSKPKRLGRFFSRKK